MPSKHLRGAASPRTVWTALALSAASPAATAGERLDLSSGWPAGLRWIGPKEGVAIGGLAGSLTALLLFLKAPDRSHWDSAVLFDDGVRNALRASSPEGRSRAGTISDVAFVLAAYPLVVDA